MSRIWVEFGSQMSETITGPGPYGHELRSIGSKNWWIQTLKLGSRQTFRVQDPYPSLGVSVDHQKEEIMSSQLEIQPRELKFVE